MGQRVRDHKARALRRLEEMQLEHGGDDVRGQHKHPVLRRKKHSSQEAPKLACDPLLVGIRRFSSSTSNTHGESPSQSTMSSSEVFASPCCVFRKAWNFDEAAQSLSRTQFERDCPLFTKSKLQLLECTRFAASTATSETYWRCSWTFISSLTSSTKSCSQLGDATKRCLWPPEGDSRMLLPRARRGRKAAEQKLPYPPAPRFSTRISVALFSVRSSPEASGVRRIKSFAKYSSNIGANAVLIAKRRGSVR